MPPPTKKSKGSLIRVNEVDDISLNEGDFLDNVGLSSTPTGTTPVSSSQTAMQNVEFDNMCKYRNQNRGNPMSEMNKPTTSSSRKRPFGDRSTIAYWERSRSLFTTHVLNPPTSIKKSPSFDVEAFVKYQSKARPQSSKTSNAPQSPFYSGRTMYGGASTAAHSLLSKDLLSSIQSQLQKQVPIRPALEVEFVSRPTEEESSLNAMSITSRRILATIEDYAKPLHKQTMFVSPDKPALIQNIKRFGDQERLQIINQEDVNRSILARTPYSRLSNSSPANKAFHRELQVATVPEILKQLRTHKLQKSVQATHELVMDYQLRTLESEKKESKSVSKMKTKVSKIRPFKNCLDQEESVPTLDLPSAQLEITNMPTFDIKLPIKCAHVKSAKTNSNKRLSVDLQKNNANINVSQSTSETDNFTDNSMKTRIFKFASPIKCENHKIKLIQSNNFEFSHPAKIPEDVDLCNDDVSPKAKKQLIITSTNKSCVMHNSNENNVNYKNKNKDTLMTAFPLKANQINKDKNDNDFQQIIKMQNSKWECTECLTRNEPDKTKCACCESLKPGTEKTKQNIVLIKNCDLPPVTNSFQDILKKQNEKWECDTCMTRNDNCTTKCMCCETTKPGSNKSPNSDIQPTPNVTASIQDLVKKQNQKWECNACFTRNDKNKTKCVCCEAPQPGLKVEKQAVFNFSPVPPTEFKFGIDKADTATAMSVTPASLANTTNFQESTKTPGGFTFGISSAQKCDKRKTAESETSLNSSIVEKRAPGIPTIGSFTFGIPPKPATISIPDSVQKTDNIANTESSNLKFNKTKPVFQFGAAINRPSETKLAVPVTFSIPSSVSIVTNNSTMITSRTSSTSNNSFFAFGSKAPISSTFNGGGSNINSVNDSSPNPAKLSMFNTIKPTTSITSPVSFKTSVKTNETNADVTEPLPKKPIFAFNTNIGTQSTPFSGNLKKTLDSKEVKSKEDKFQFGSSSDTTTTNQIKPFSFASKVTSNSDKPGLFVFGSNGGTDGSTARSPFNFSSGQTSTPGFAVNKINNTFGTNQSTTPSGVFSAVAPPNTQQHTPVFGSNTSSNTNAPAAFTFGSNTTAQPVQGSAVFTFGNAKPLSPAASTPGGFNFSAAGLGAPQIPSSSSFGNDAKSSSSISFSMGSGPQGPRKIKKAVRRTQR